MPLPSSAGKVPFGEVGQPDETIYDAIQTKEMAWGGADKHLSAAARDFISGLLRKNPAHRLTIDEALQHPWVAGDAASTVPFDRAIIQNLLAFNARNKFRRDAVHLVARDLSKEQVASLSESFKRLDKDGSGQISHAELVTALRSLGFTSTSDVEKLIQAMDTDGNGRISWLEFTDAASDLLIQKSQIDLW